MKKRILTLILAVAMVLMAVPVSYAAGTDEADYIELVYPKYDWWYWFSEGLALVQINYKYGYIDKYGNEVIPLIYDFGLNFTEGLAGVKVDGKWGFIDKTGKMVVPPKYQNAREFHEGMAAVMLNGKWGFIDKTGKEVVPPKYVTVEAFKEGMAAVNLYLYDTWGFIDKTGKEVVKPQYRRASSFSEGLALVENDDRRGAYIDKTGKVVIPPKYKLCADFSEGLAAVANTGYDWGYIDKTGKMVIPMKYSLAGEFHDGLAEAELGTWRGYIDKTGKQVITLKGKALFFSALSQGLLGVEMDNGDVVFIDKTGKEVIKTKYDFVEPFIGECAPFRSADTLKWGAIDMTGKEVVPPIYDYIESFAEGMASVEIDGKWGHVMINPLKTASTWAKDSIKSAITKGFVPKDILDNYQDGITRAEFCRLTIKYIEYALGKSIDIILAEKGLTRELNTFMDTKDTDILAAYALGVTSGTGNKTFTPEGRLTREQAATMIANACKVLGWDTGNAPASSFDDLTNASNWAVDSINFCYANGIMVGSNNKFYPKDTYTREQSIVTFSNIKQVQ